MKHYIFGGCGCGCRYKCRCNCRIFFIVTLFPSGKEAVVATATDVADASKEDLTVVILSELVFLLAVVVAATAA